jgi:hypothetical protein
LARFSSSATVSTCGSGASGTRWKARAKAGCRASTSASSSVEASATITSSPATIGPSRNCASPRPDSRPGATVTSSSKLPAYNTLRSARR